ncbi:MAG: OmpA family protein [Comamonadaceae bacterium]|nr:OmpA family protein [Comamonadaceae bacterium]
MALDLAFESGSARLRPESGRTLGNLYAAMISPQLRAERFVIEGHTDAVGSPTANLRLSQRRADEVAGYLMALGVARERLRAVGRGSADPADPLHPRAAVNRRVRVVTQP